MLVDALTMARNLLPVVEKVGIKHGRCHLLMCHSGNLSRILRFDVRWEMGEERLQRTRIGMSRTPFSKGNSPVACSVQFTVFWVSQSFGRMHYLEEYVSLCRREF